MRTTCSTSQGFEAPQRFCRAPKTKANQLQTIGSRQGGRQGTLMLPSAASHPSQQNIAADRGAGFLPAMERSRGQCHGNRPGLGRTCFAACRLDTFSMSKPTKQHGSNSCVGCAGRPIFLKGANSIHTGRIHCNICSLKTKGGDGNTCLDSPRLPTLP